MISVRIIEGDENINRLCIQAMHATLDALIAEDLITQQVGIAFADTHVCMDVEPGVFSRVLKKLFDKDNTRVIIVKAVA